MFSDFDDDILFFGRAGEFKCCEMCGLSRWYGNICLPCRHKRFLDWLYSQAKSDDGVIHLSRDIVSAKLHEYFQ